MHMSFKFSFKRLYTWQKLVKLSWTFQSSGAATENARSPFPFSLARGTARSCCEEDLRELGVGNRAKEACKIRWSQAREGWIKVKGGLHYLIPTVGRSRCHAHNFSGCGSCIVWCRISTQFPVLKPPCLPLGLQSGDNTLNILCSLRATQALASSHFTDVSQPDARATVLSDYVRFLTTPASHSDTYAESCHRSFFSDWRHSRPTSPREVNQTRPTQRLLPIW